MGWTQDTGTGVITHSGTTLEVFVLSEHADIGADGDNLAHELHLTDIDHHVRLRFLMAGSNTGWEAGIMTDGGAADTNITLRRIVNGTPGSAVATVAHGISAGTPYVFRVELSAGSFAIRTVAAGVTTAQIDYDNDTAPTYLENTGVGIASDVDGATVLLMTTEERAYETPSLNEIEVWVCDKKVWIRYEDQAEPQLIGSVPFPKDVQLSFAEFGGKGYIVGGGFAYIVDPINATVAAWTPTTGSLPGQTGPGTTTAIQVIRAGPRLALADRAERQLVYTAVNAPLEIDTGAGLFETGAAYSVGAGGTIRFGEDLIGAYYSPEGYVLVACQFSIFAIVGDPVISNIQQVPISLDSGASNFAAMASIDVTGRTAVHTPDGVAVVANGGQGSFNLSRGQLRDDLEFPRSERAGYRVQLIRDTRAGILFIFRTTEAEESSTHWAYFEDTGKYQDGMGGFFRTTMPTEYGPTAVVNSRGRVLMGGRDGRVRRFADDYTQTEDDGETVTAYMPCSMIDEKGLYSPVMLTNARCLFSEGSSRVTVRAYGGSSAERLIDRTLRRRLYTFGSRTGQNDLPTADLPVPVSDGAVLLEMSAADGGWFALEYIDADVEPGVAIRAATDKELTHGVCRVETPAAFVGDDPWTPTQPSGGGGPNPDPDGDPGDDPGGPIVTKVSDGIVEL